MKLTVTKKFRTETAHRLYENYEGDCFFFHGHTFHYEISVAQRRLSTLDSTGFVLELSKLNVVREWLDNNWNHALLLHSSDPAIELLKTLYGNQGYRVFTFQDQNPTIEVIIVYLAEKVKELLGKLDCCYVSKLVVHETPFQSVTLELDED